MTFRLACRGSMGSDGVYRDPVAYAPKFSLMVAEPGIRALLLVFTSFGLLFTVYAHRSVVAGFLITAKFLLPTTPFVKEDSLLCRWVSTQPIQGILGIICASLMLYVWYSALRYRAHGYRLPTNLTQSTRPPSWMKGKVAVVTGGNAGIGLETTKQLARWGVHVLVGCRRAEEATQIAQEFLLTNSCNRRCSVPPSRCSSGKSANRAHNSSTCEKCCLSGAGTIHVHYLDLMDFQTIQRFAKWAIKEGGGKIDLLVNNAGIVSTGKLTVDLSTGFERHFVTNHIGPFLLTQLLLPALKKANGRVINVSSLAHVAAGPNFRPLDYAISPETATAIASKLKRSLKQLQGEPISAQNYDTRRVYADTKLANIWFTKALQRRLTADKTTTATAYALHPGLVNTHLLLHYSQGSTNWISYAATVFHKMVAPLVFKTPEEGAATQLMLCVADQQQLKAGAFYRDGTTNHVSPLALDEGKQEELWEMSMLVCQPYLEGH